MKANSMMLAIAAVAACTPVTGGKFEMASRPDRRNAPPLRLDVYGEPASASDLVRLARKNARRRRR